MPLNRHTTRLFHKFLYATQLQTITLLKRNNDQQAGTVQSYTVYQARIRKEMKSAEPIQKDMTADHRTVWCLPYVELERIGVQYINAADRIVDSQNRYWQPESTTLIELWLFQNHIQIACVRIDPPGAGPA